MFKLNKTKLTLILLLTLSCWLSTLADTAHSSVTEWQDVRPFNEGKQLLASGLTVQGPQLLVADINADTAVSTKRQISLQAELFQGFGTGIFIVKDRNGDGTGSEPKELIILYGSDGIYILRNDSPEKIIDMAQVWRTVDPRKFSYLNHTVDVNNDGLTDFLLPDFKEHHLFVQLPNGQFQHQIITVGMSQSYFSDELSGNSLIYTFPKVNSWYDFNGDNRSDIATVTEKNLTLFIAGRDGKYLEASSKLHVPLLNEQKSRVGINERLSTPEYSLVTIDDLNGDALPDIVLQHKYYVEGEDHEMERLVLMCGTQSDSGSVQYSKEGIIRIPVEGERIQTGFADFNGDGKKELYYIALELGAGSVMSAFFGNSFDIEISIHLQSDECAFDTDVTESKKASFVTDVRNAALGSFVKAVDVNNDGSSDLLVLKDTRNISLYLGGGKRLLSKKARKTKMSKTLNPIKLKTVEIANRHYLIDLQGAGLQATRIE